jgi:hypothetical protein
MMFKHTSVLAAVLLTLGVGCGSLGGGPLIELEKRGDGLTYRKGDPAPYTGQLTMTTRGTNEKWVTHFKEGRRDGLFAVFYSNGKPKANAMFARGKLVSGITWKPDGTEGSRVEKGTGRFLMFHPDGSKARESVYENGVRIRRSDFPPAGSADGQ